MRVKICSLMTILLALALQFRPQAAGATTYDHAVGLSYVSGVSDVYDAYEDIPWLYSESEFIPVGVGYRFIVNHDSGMRIDAGLGPIVYIGGAVEMFDIPFQLTAGYSFLPEKKFRPYIRGGVSYHLGSGDYNDNAGLGFLGAVGIEIGTRGKFSFFTEASYDTAETEFHYQDRKEDIKIHGFVLSMGVIF